MNKDDVIKALQDSEYDVMFTYLDEEGKKIIINDFQTIKEVKIDNKKHTIIIFK